MEPGPFAAHVCHSLGAGLAADWASIRAAQRTLVVLCHWTDRQIFSSSKSVVDSRSREQEERVFLKNLDADFQEWFSLDEAQGGVANLSHAHDVVL